MAYDALPEFRPGAHQRSGGGCVLIIGKREAGKTWLARSLVLDLLLGEDGAAAARGAVLVGGLGYEAPLWRALAPGVDVVPDAGSGPDEVPPVPLLQLAGQPALLVLDDWVWSQWAVSQWRLRSWRPWGEAAASSVGPRSVAVVVTMQYAMYLPSAMQACLDYVCVFGDASASNRVRLHAMFASAMGASAPTMEEWGELMGGMKHERHDCLVLDVRPDGQRGRAAGAQEPRVWRYRAPSDEERARRASLRAAWGAWREAVRQRRAAAALCALGRRGLHTPLVLREVLGASGLLE